MKKVDYSAEILALKEQINNLSSKIEINHAASQLKDEVIQELRDERNKKINIVNIIVTAIIISLGISFGLQIYVYNQIARFEETNKNFSINYEAVIDFQRIMLAFTEKRYVQAQVICDDLIEKVKQLKGASAGEPFESVLANAYIMRGIVSQRLDGNNSIRDLERYGKELLKFNSDYIKGKGYQFLAHACWYKQDSADALLKQDSVNFSINHDILNNFELSLQHIKKGNTDALNIAEYYFIKNDFKNASYWAKRFQYHFGAIIDYHPSKEGRIAWAVYSHLSDYILDPNDKLSLQQFRADFNKLKKNRLENELFDNEHLKKWFADLKAGRNKYFNEKKEVRDTLLSVYSEIQEAWSPTPHFNKKQVNDLLKAHPADTSIWPIETSMSMPEK